MDPNERDVAVASSAVQIAQHECDVLAIGVCGVPMELEGPVRGREHGRDDPAYLLRFRHLASLPQRLRPMETRLATSKLGPAEKDEAVPGISICPRCGMRLVTKNLWHSCRTFTLDGLFPTAWLESGSPDFRRVRTAFV
jgi:hypothetical protein